MRRLGARLARVEERERARTEELPSGSARLLVYPDGWPPDDLVAFDGDDPVIRADGVARPGPGTKLIAIRVRPDGPR